MAEQILDGTTSGSRAKVGTDNRLQVRALTESEAVHFAELGSSYNFNTGNISVTADATLVYIKNNSADTFVIESLVFAIGDGFTHTDFPYVTLVRNPTGGDLISDATAISMNQNRNFGSSNSADVNVYKGKVGGTLTGGNNIALVQLAKTGRTTVPIYFLLPRGSSLGVTLDITISGGSANVYAAIIGYFKDDLDAQ